MTDADRCKLLGTYQTPRCYVGEQVICEVRGDVKIVGLTDTPLPWPLCTSVGPSPGPAVTSYIYSDVHGDQSQGVARRADTLGETQVSPPEDGCPGGTPMQLHERIYAVYERCAPLFRDTELPPGVLEKYKVGLFLREPTFCDTTYNLSGFIAPHRFLFISSSARCLDGIGEDRGWGLCVFQRGRIFKVIDRIGDGLRTQITLLEIPPDLLEFFSALELNDLEKSFVEQSRETFRQALEMKPLPELDNERWKQRLVFPVGVDDGGRYFPLQFDPMAPGAVIDPAQLGFRLARVLNHQAQIHYAAGDLDEAEPLLAEAIEIEKARALSKPPASLDFKFFGEVLS